MNNLQAIGWDLSDIKYVELTDKELANWKLESGDIVFNRTNSKELVGKCEVFREPGTWVFASYLMRLQVNEDETIPEFISAFLNGQTGRMQINRESRQIIGMSNINAEEIRTLRLPFPKPSQQRSLLSKLDTARTVSLKKHAAADALLGKIDLSIFQTLGIEPPPQAKRSAYAVRTKDVLNHRFDPHFFDPQFVELVALLKTIPHRPLGYLIEFSHETWSPDPALEPTFRYIEISRVNLVTGIAVAVETPTNEAPSRARMKVRAGDILVSLTRPHHGAIALADSSLNGSIASTGFAILRDLRVDGLDREYLWLVLRSQLSLLQMKQRSSGGNYPAITEAELSQILIPYPDQLLQHRIVNVMHQHQREATTLHMEAEETWAEAKLQFENALLGDGADV